MQSSFIFLILLATLLIVVNSLQINSVFLLSDTLKQYSLDISNYQEGNIVSAVFNFTNSNMLSTTFVMASFTGYYTASQIDLTSFNGKRPEDYAGIMDLKSMQLGSTQYINMIKEANSSILYLTIFNLDPILANGQINIGNARISDIPFKITVTQSLNYVCYSCQNLALTSQVSQDCQCQNCNAGFFGPHCQYQLNFLSDGQIRSFWGYSQSLTFFQIPPLQSDAKLSINITAGPSQIFIQSISFDGEFASYTNTNLNLPQQGKYIINQTEQEKFVMSLPQSTTKTSIVIANYLTQTFNINASFKKNTSSSSQTDLIIIIVLSVGALIILGIMIGLCYIFKNPTAQQLKNMLEVQNKMSDIDIQMYFPTVILDLDFNPQQQWNLQLKNEMKNKRKECVICLNPLLLQEQLKVTYCHHIFHEKCLSQWFKKQLNCPCCRYQFSKSKVIQYYQKTAQQIGIKNPSKAQLIRQLLSPGKTKHQVKTINPNETNILKIVNALDAKNPCSSTCLQVSSKNVHEVVINMNVKD